MDATTQDAHISTSTTQLNASPGQLPPLSDRTDFANADRGLIGTLDPMVIKAADGRVVLDMDSWGFLAADCPDTVNPSLWRQTQLTAKHGLYEVTDGICHARE
jgi:alkyl sulfatase BDS1-like metallo-beta-lactamase superfamily hydrolase